jgi:polysaccharide export outer membrane protein
MECPKAVDNNNDKASRDKSFYWPAAGPAKKLPFAGRVIRIPMQDLRAGNANYNVVIRKDDVVHVPMIEAGYYYMGGNVNRPGTYNITNVPVTLTRAIIAAGGVGPLAAPAKVDLTRRIGSDKQQIVQVDLAKIFAGLQPDYYIKKDDIINVGTSPVSPWLAVLRNGFRATYGFGFVYDRNYADRDVGKPFELPNLLFW